MSIKPRWDHKRDEHEPAIRAVLRKANVKTYPISGEGIPDLLCVSGSVLFLIEVKGKGGVLTKAQEVFHAEMRHANAGCYVVHDADEAMQAYRSELARR